MIEHGLKLLAVTSEKQTDTVIENDVIAKIRGLIKKHNFEEGDRLPSERKLSDKFGVTRNQIRAAIQKLEFYGIIETMPQSGSMISGMGVPSFKTVMTDVLDLDTPNFKSLIESRVIIESNAVQLAAARCSEQSLVELEKAHENFVYRIVNGLPSLIEDIKFHLAIVKTSENTVLYGLMKVIVPDIIGHFNKEQICDRSQALKLVQEHEDILIAIKNKNPEKASTALRLHFRALRDYINKTN
ncbi:MAG: FadR/GntR family transcriptional regulator [Nonlabens sp.]|uniref:FadR/GntR family transcriptional regulator n=1 Tax=Nonlabens sp. TaxID=1888209 RepID=UPI003EF1E934